MRPIFTRPYYISEILSFADTGQALAAFNLIVEQQSLMTELKTDDLTGAFLKIYDLDVAHETYNGSSLYHYFYKTNEDYRVSSKTEHPAKYAGEFLYDVFITIQEATVIISVPYYKVASIFFSETHKLLKANIGIYYISVNIGALVIKSGLTAEYTIEDRPINKNSATDAEPIKCKFDIKECRFTIVRNIGDVEIRMKTLSGLRYSSEYRYIVNSLLDENEKKERNISAVRVNFLSFLIMTMNSDLPITEIQTDNFGNYRFKLKRDAEPIKQFMNAIRVLKFDEQLVQKENIPVIIFNKEESNYEQ
jgi:hypothetical protein